MLSSLRIFAATLAMVALEGCVHTAEDDNDYHFASCDNRLNRPVISANSRGEYDASAVNTQQIGCAGAKRTFEIIADRAGG